MPRILRGLRINEVSSVDRGAGEGVKIMLMKREGDVPMPGKTNTGIRSIFAKLFGDDGDNDVVIDTSVEALAGSISSILSDDKIVDKAEAMEKTFGQFSDHLKGTLTVGSTVTTKKENDMDIAVLKKALGLADTATEADVTAAITKNMTASAALVENVRKMAYELAVSKADFTPAELEFYNKAGTMFDNEDDAANASDDDKAKKKAKKSFREASHTERALLMKSAAPALDPAIQQILDDNKEMKKQLATLQAGGNLVEMAALAKSHGLPETEAETIQKALTGDKASIDKLLGFIKTATIAANKGGLFKELGSGLGGNVGDKTPYEEIVDKAKELRKADPKLSEAQAFAKVYQDPANAELVAKEIANPHTIPA